MNQRNPLHIPLIIIFPLQGDNYGKYSLLVLTISTIENDFCHSFRPFKLFVKPLHEVLYLLGLTAAPTVNL